MTATVTMTCPNGCVELEVSAEHAARPDEELLAEALPEDHDKARNRLCPACTRLMDMEESAA